MTSPESLASDRDRPPLRPRMAAALKSKLQARRDLARELAREVRRLAFHVLASRGGKRNTVAQNEARRENLKRARWQKKHPGERYQEEYR